MAPISPCQSGRRVITGDSTAHLSSFLTPVCVCISVCLFEWPLEQMWILHHLHNRPRVYCLSCTPSCSSQRDPLPFTWSAKSDDERLITRLPAGILEHRDGVTQPIWACARMEPQTNQNTASLLCVSVHVHFSSVCMQSCYI